MAAIKTNTSELVLRKTEKTTTKKQEEEYSLGNCRSCHTFYHGLRRKNH